MVKSLQPRTRAERIVHRILVVYQIGIMRFQRTIISLNPSPPFLSADIEVLVVIRKKSLTLKAAASLLLPFTSERRPALLKAAALTLGS